MKKNDIGKNMPYMSPLVNREDASKQNGFTENFEVETATRMVSSSGNKVYSPSKVKIVNFYRFEGMSDPGDSNILYEIETNDGKKGLLVTPYGPDCPAHIGAFVEAIPHIEKKPHESE